VGQDHGHTGVALWRLHSDAVNERLIRRWLPAGLGSVLKTDLFDELVSPGLYPALRERAREVVGVDIAPETVAGAAARHPELETAVASVTDLPFSSARFDAVVSNSTLDHLEREAEASTALAELARVLKPGGTLLITLDNPLNPVVAVRNALPSGLARAIRRVPYDAGWTCGPRRLRGLLARSGLPGAQTTAVMHAPRIVIAELDRHGRRPAPGEHAVARLVAAERLERWPSRYLTGYFVAARAVRAQR
jgi:SAM-dependent methyltransferase